MSKPPSQLKLYVWEDVLEDYTSGIMCALATSPEHARELLRKDPEWSATGYIERDMMAEEPQEYDVPVAFAVYGGG